MAYNKITLNGETKIDLTQDTVTAGDVALGKTFHLSSGEIATGTHTTQLQEKTVTPTKSVQEVTPDASYDGLGKVNVNAIPNEYIVPTGTKAITENGTHVVTEYASVEVNVPSQTPNLITKEITENGTYNASDEGADGYSSVTVNVASSGGGGGAFFDTTFANNTPEQISKVSGAIAYNHMTSAEVEANFGWKIGDTISYQRSTGDNVEMRILGFNHDYKSDGTGKAGITLGMTHCLPTKYKMSNKENSNEGGYPASLMKTYTLPQIKATLPQEWQNVIKTVDKKSANGGGSNYSETLTTSEDLFLLSENEVYGSITYAQDGVNEGTQYEYWVGKSDADRAKKYDKDGDGILEANAVWFLRSSIGIGITAFCAVNSVKGNITFAASQQAWQLSFAFCI